MAFYCNGLKGVCKCDILCVDCKHFDNSGGKYVQTNADRIRAMSDEELAEFLTEEKWKCDNWRVCKECPRAMPFF